MTLQTFREMLTRRPFRPVKLTLSSGQAYEIRHPEMALLTRSSILIGTDLADDGVPRRIQNYLAASRHRHRTPHPASGIIIARWDIKRCAIEAIVRKGKCWWNPGGV